VGDCTWDGQGERGAQSDQQQGLPDPLAITCLKHVPDHGAPSLQHNSVESEAVPPWRLSFNAARRFNADSLLVGAV
jgi:hypothetical protein